MEQRTMKIMWDYLAFPLWVEHGSIGQASTDSVLVSAQLRSDLQAWSDRMTRLMNGADQPGARAWSDAQAAKRRQLNSQGIELARRVRAELDGSWAVVFFDELTDSTVAIEHPAR